MRYSIMAHGQPHEHEAGHSSSSLDRNFAIHRCFLDSAIPPRQDFIDELIQITCWERDA